MQFTTNIRSLRLESNMTQEQLAVLVGVRRETIVFLEQAKYMPSLELAYKIARVFDKHIEDVFSFD